jgi:hypothetical protein
MLPFLPTASCAAEDISRPHNCIDWAGEAFKEARGHPLLQLLVLQGSMSPGEQTMSDRIEPQKIETTEFDDELSDEALDRQEAALSANCGYTAGH